MRPSIVFLVFLALILLSCTNAAVSAAAEPGLHEIMQELKALKARVGDLEKKLEAAEQRAAKAEQAAASASAAATEARHASANSLKISQEAAEARQEQPAGLLSQAAKKIQVYGAVEVEASWQNYKPDSGESNSESGFTLATAELFVEAEINEYTKGLLHLLYEEGDTDYLDVDEAFILIGQTEEVPFYFMGGRIYPAVGLFESYMVSDPITQNVFETQASAAEIGYASGWMNLGLGGYNAGVHEGGDDPDSNINTFYARLQVALPEKIAGDDLSIQAGVAYTNNIAGGNLGEEVPDERLGSLVGGWSAMVQAEYKWLGFAAEYISALDDFAPGELSFAEDDSVRPAAYQIELALMPVDGWTFALRYEGSSDLGDFEPETQWGAAVSYDLLPDTTLSVEYMRGEYENDDTRDLVTTQLAVGF